MNVRGEITVAAPREAVFAALQNARFFASCLDGVRDLKEIDATHYAAVFETRIAYLRFTFNITVELTRVEPPQSIAAKLEGRPIGVVGRLTATSAATLAEIGAETSVRYSIDVALTGKLGSLGQPVLRAKAKEMEKQFTGNLRAAFASGAVELAR